jgi:hypothetical protein
VRYEEACVELSVPLSILHQIEASLLHEVFVLNSLEKNGQLVKKNAVPRAEKALDFITDAITGHEARLIIGDALTDDSLSKVFPNKTKKKRTKKK